MTRYNCKIDLEAIITLFCFEVRYSTNSRRSSAFITRGHLAHISRIAFNLRFNVTIETVKMPSSTRTCNFKDPYPTAITSAEFRSVTKLFTMALTTVSKTSGGKSSCEDWAPNSSILVTSVKYQTLLLWQNSHSALVVPLTVNAAECNVIILNYLFGAVAKNESNKGRN